MNRAKRILGVDPGTRITGFGIIEIDNRYCFSAIDYGCIRPPAKDPIAMRYRIIHESLLSLIKNYKPDAVVIETQYIHRNPQSGIKLGMARGVAMLAASLQEIPIFEYAPSYAKKAVVGSGRASKEQMQNMVKQLLHLSAIPSPPDAADALALAICHGHVIKRDWLCMRT